MPKKIALSAFVSFIALCLASCAAQTAFTDSPADMEKAAASAVRLTVFNSRDEIIGTGSGFIAGNPAVLVTSKHVLVNMDHAVAQCDDGTTFQTDRIIAIDDAADIAVCLLPDGIDLTPLPLSAQAPLRGEKAAVVASQFGLVNLVSLGNISGIWHTDETDWILFTAPVSSGCSGGPLMNDQGEVIGVVSFTYDKGQNLNLAAPAQRLIDLIGENREYSDQISDPITENQSHP